MVGEKRNLDIGIVTHPVDDAGLVPLSNLVDIISAISDNLCLVTGNAGAALSKNHAGVHMYLVNQKIRQNLFAKIVSYIYMQLRISWKLAKLTRSMDLWIFFIGGQPLLIPMITLKLSRKKVLLAFGGSDIKSVKGRGNIISKPMELLVRINCALSDRIIVYSARLIDEYDLGKYRNKISIAHEHYLDFHRFNIQKRLAERAKLVSYIGRLSEEKGILNFLEAIPKLFERGDDIKFLIGGNGELRGKAEAFLNREELSSKVNFLEWISHDVVPKYLNESKLLVLPSYTEGLPNIMLEAMACGTPVLATPVGVIPDVIRDSETGFIMEDNSPECIARNVVRALNHPDLERISMNALAIIEKEYTYEVSAERYRNMLTSLRLK